MDVFWEAPPVSRTITALALVESLLYYSETLSFYNVVFLRGKLFKALPEVWRLVTPFLLTGWSFDFLFDLYFMYHYGSSLEIGSPRFSQPGDFFVYLIFVACTILVSAGLWLQSFIFTQALILAFAHTYAQDNRGKKVKFFVLQIPVLWLPWAILTMTLVRSGWGPVKTQFTGIIASHLYDFLTRIYPTFGGGKNYIFTPAWVRRYIFRHTPDAARRAYGRAYRPSRPADPQPEPDSGTRGWTSSQDLGSWGTRGSGRRLG
ncbi:uncharacterized protein N7498_002913 [Penicillium cinerascens]|uniref:Derlin n=1 Tax=Penicillium cinerascens TaxID=70096 RepID=A0A9W9NAW7_9EURO|nr:uncharacterized protein N7498_002913 [Penicillium cinerascens]KAJ5216506.1 hypothetical protein N7498_002913 [Penicillium cinerascens]